jgi:hypothetical protein
LERNIPRGGGRKQGDDFTVKSWTDKAVATEYRDSLDIESDPQKKAKWLTRQKALTDRQLKFDSLRFSIPDSQEPEADDQEN